MLFHSGQILTMRGGAQRGNTLGNLHIISDGAIMVNEGEIQAVDTSDALISSFPDEKRFDVKGNVILPGFVDPHTHLIFAGDRAGEFAERIAGKSYMEIMQAGGGINATVSMTRDASIDELVESGRKRLDRMLSLGTTTVEAKTGYGLDIETELRMLQAILLLDDVHPIDIVPTFLAAHAIPTEYNGDSQGYTNFICSTTLPALEAWWEENGQAKPKPFVDVFCEDGAFSLAQSRQILETAVKLGFPIKIHADEFENLGGASLAVELGAVSADHLVVTSEKDIATLGKSDTVAVSLPCTPFGLGEKDYTPARELLDANAYLAIATDLNPGTAWCESMQFAIALACRYLRLTPAQAIAASTINAAKAVNREDIVGSIEVGKQADFIILDAKDYNHLGYRFGGNLVKTVIKKGKVVDAYD